jgi:hypothetical protein
LADHLAKNVVTDGKGEILYLKIPIYTIITEGKVYVITNWQEQCPCTRKGAIRKLFFPHIKGE